MTFHVQPRKIVQTVILVALVVAIPMGVVDAFAPTSVSIPQQQTRLYSTAEKEEDQARQQPSSKQQQQKQTPNNIPIKIAPLGSSIHTHHANGHYLKEFPTFEMKERFRKIRSPRKNTPKVVKPRRKTIKEPSPQVVPPLASANSCPPLLFGIGEFFDTNQLIQTVRENADVGKPLESSRSLAEKIPVGTVDSTSTSSTSTTTSSTFLSCGSASCTQGGWPSKTKSNTTQIFYLLHGFGCLTDMDGTRHYFGPGDTVVVPLGWAGRADVAEDLHKIWFTLDHEPPIIVAEEKEIDDDDDKDSKNNSSTMVRAKVIHYHELIKWSFRHTLNDEKSLDDDPHKSETSFYDVDDDALSGMGLSCVTCFSPSASVPFCVPSRKYVDCFHILEGTMVLTPLGTSKENNNNNNNNNNNEPTFEFTSGDTVVLPKGWTGYCEIKDPVKALRVKA